MTYLTNIDCKIPLNEKNFFAIKKNNWNYSIDIIVNSSVKLNFINFFMILKCYYMSSGIFIIGFYFIISNFEDKENFFIYKKLNHKKFLYISYSEFLLWFEDFLEVEKEYVKSYKLYGFRLVFDEASIPYSKGTIYPIYPWPENILNQYSYISKIYKTTNKNNFYKKKYLSLLNTILKNQRVWYRNIYRRKRQ